MEYLEYLRLSPDLDSPIFTAVPDTKDLPPEIWDTILDIVATVAEPASALFFCLLTCRSWVPKCRFLLYSDVHIKDDHVLARVVRCLTLRPDNALRVRSLRLGGPGAPFIDSWAHKIPLHFALKMKNLEHLNLDRLHFSSVHPDLYRNFTSLRNIQHLTLRDVQCTSVTQLIRFASAFPRRDTLTLAIKYSGYDYEYYRLPLASTVLDRSYNRSLLINRLELMSFPSRQLSATLSLLSEARITSVSVVSISLRLEEAERFATENFALESIASITSFLSICAEGLLDLSLAFPATVAMGDLVKHLTLSNCLNLHTLSLKTDFCSHSSDIAALAKLLSLLHAHHLAVLQLSFFVNNFWNIPTEG